MGSQSLKLEPYQEEAADFLYPLDRGMVQAKVGAGKTAVACTLMGDLLRDRVVRRFLVVAPKRVCLHTWPVELPKWAPQLRFAVAVGTPQERRDAVEGRPGNDVVVINFENLLWLAEQYPDLADRFDGLIVDELTKMKEPKGKRFKSLDKLMGGFKVAYGLTGSFNDNGLEGTFGQCRILSKNILGRSKGAFLQQYFIPIDPQRGEWIPRAGSFPLVMARVKPYAYVLEPAQYEQPPVWPRPIVCDMDRVAYSKMKKDFAVEVAEAQVTAINAAVMTGKLRQMAAGFVYETHRRPDPDRPGKFIVTQTPHFMSPHKLDALEELWEENQRAPMMVFYRYQEELAQLLKRFPQAEELTDHNIDAWNAGKVPILILHPMSAGHGLNLQYAPDAFIVWTVPPWPREVELWKQANGRVARKGRKTGVYAYLLLTEGTIDMECWGGLQANLELAERGEEILRDIDLAEVLAA